jgi:hypothetical protein
MKRSNFILCFIIFLFSQCGKKENMQSIKEVMIAEQKSSFSNVTISQPKSISPYGTRQEEIPTAAAIFQQIDPVYLQSLNSPGADPTPFINQLSEEVCAYMLEKYQVDLNEDSWNVPAENVAVGLIFAAFETGLYSNRASGSKVNIIEGGNLDCFISAVSGMIGIGEITALYNDFVRGVSARTVARALKFTLRRVATVVSVTFAIYEVGECLDWW